MINNAKEIKTYRDLLDFYDASIILNNEIMKHYFEDFELESGEDYDEEEDEYVEIYQYYIVTPYFAHILENLCVDQIVYYSDKLDMYLWGVTHYGTDWSYVPVETIYNS